MMSKDWTTLWGQARHRDLEGWSQLSRRGGARPPHLVQNRGIPGAGRRGGGQRSGSSTAPGALCWGSAGKAASVGAGARAAAPGPRGGGWRASRRLPAAAAELFAASTSWEPRPGRPQGDWEAGGQAGLRIRTRGQAVLK